MVSVATFEANWRSVGFGAPSPMGIEPTLAGRVATAATELAVDELLAHVCCLLVQELPVERCEVVAGLRGPADAALQLPLVVRGGMVGTLCLSSDHGAVELTPDQRVELDGVGAVLALVLHHAEVARRSSQTTLTGGAVGDIVGELNRTLPPTAGIRMLSVSLVHPQLRAALGGRPPDREESDALQAWSAAFDRSAPLQVRQASGGVLAPVTLPNRLLGVLRATAAGPWSDRIEPLLLEIGARCADLVTRASLQRHLVENDRRTAVSIERDRIAQDLHDSVGQLITGMGLRLALHLADAPDEAWRCRLQELLDLTARGNRELRKSIEGLLSHDRATEGLGTTVDRLCRDFEDITGVTVMFSIDGTSVPLGAAKEDALFRVAHETFLNVERHANASMVSVALSYGDEAVSLSVRDDGRGFGDVDPFRQPGRLGIRTMRRRIEDVGGELRVDRAAPHGVLVEAVIPRRSAHADGTGGGHR